MVIILNPILFDVSLLLKLKSNEYLLNKGIRSFMNFNKSSLMAFLEDRVKLKEPKLSKVTKQINISWVWLIYIDYSSKRFLTESLYN